MTPSLKARAENAGVEVSAESWGGMMHVWHFFHPILSEGRDAIARIGSSQGASRMSLERRARPANSKRIAAAAQKARRAGAVLLRGSLPAADVYRNGLARAGRGALIFYLVFLPAMFLQWRMNSSSCVLNNIESLIRTGRWRDPANREEGAWLRTLVNDKTGWNLSARGMDVFMHSVMLLFWLLALARLQGWLG